MTKRHLGYAVGMCAALALAPSRALAQQRACTSWSAGAQTDACAPFAWPPDECLRAVVGRALRARDLPLAARLIERMIERGAATVADEYYLAGVYDHLKLAELARGRYEHFLQRARATPDARVNALVPTAAARLGFLRRDTRRFTLDLANRDQGLQPRGASVRVNGVEVSRGALPASTEVLPGDHTVAVCAPGFASWSQDTQVHTQGVTLRAELSPLPRPLRLVVTPCVARVALVVAGERRSVACAGDRAEWTADVAPGRVVVEASTEGHRGVSRELTVEPGVDPRDERVELEAITRTVTLRAAPPHVMVTRTDEAGRRTPVTMEDLRHGMALRRGRYTFDARAAGYAPERRDVVIDGEGAALPVVLALRRVERSVSAPALAVGGVGAAGLAAAGVLAVLRATTLAQCDEPDGRGLRRCDPDVYGTGSDLSVATNVTLGVGATLFVTGAVWFVVDLLSHRAPVAARAETEGGTF